MRNLIGITVCVLSVVAAIYFGFWVCLIGGIVAIVEAIKSNPVDSMGIALGILRILVTSFVFWFTFIVGIGLGVSLIKK